MTKATGEPKARFGQAEHLTVKHRTIEIDGIGVFYREAGPVDAPALLLPHGYPSSSYQFRHFMPKLADRWRLVAPDFPGFGYSGTPDPTRFNYTFGGYADFLEHFTGALNLKRYALYLHDYGSQIGLRLAMKAPERIAALVIQNGDIYEDELGPKYEGLKAYWANPTPERRAKLAEAVSEEGFRDEFLNEVPENLAERISPDLWKQSWQLMSSQERREISIGLMEGLRENIEWFPRYQTYLREHRPPTLIVWGPLDGYMPEGAARAYLRDLPDAELHLLDGGHWLLETQLEEVVAFAREFLGRVHSSVNETPLHAAVDQDLETMSRDQLVKQAKKLRNAIRQHRDSSRHDLCWHHPALWSLLPERTDPIPEVPEWPEFLEGCINYRRSLDEQAPHAPRTKKPYQR